MKRQADSPAGEQIHDNFSKFRGANSVVESIVGGDSKDKEPPGVKGVKHLLRART